MQLASTKNDGISKESGMSALISTAKSWGILGGIMGQQRGDKLYAAQYKMAGNRKSHKNEDIIALGEKSVTKIKKKTRRITNKGSKGLL